ncbi:MAG: YkgJ family cysteine cluster protein [Candidatus Theseobacter exili]|nr:YkgJ family cysteine cluster protein [Candidatus Theseobacter exili]
MKKNTWAAKLIRTATSVLPVSSERHGNCNGCGECCKLPNACPFLRSGTDGKHYCSIYTFRPLSCRKYPRTKSEFITEKKCGYSFNSNKN